MRAEFEQGKQQVAEVSLKDRVLKESLLGKEPPCDNRCAAAQTRDRGSSVLADHSGYILACERTATLAATHVHDTLELVLTRDRPDRVRDS